MFGAAVVGGAAGLGDRLRAARRAAGLTQEELADGRFTKQYVSQIENGRTWPTGDVLDWLAARLGVERAFLELGFTSVAAERLEEALGQATRLLDERRYDEALALLRPARAALDPKLASAGIVRAAATEAWALIRLGQLDEAEDVLADSTRLAELLGDDAVRAGVAYVTGVHRLMRSELEQALVDFRAALELLGDSMAGDDALRIDILQWRSRVYRRLGDLEAAREDVDVALELCETLGDPRRLGEVSLQASLVAERAGRWILARRLAAAALDRFEECGDVVTAGRALNNLAGLDHLLGNDESAMRALRTAFAIFAEAKLEAEAGYVLSSLAEIHRARGELDIALLEAERSLALLGERLDHVQEIGTAQLVVARAHLERSELDRAEAALHEVDRSYALAESVGHQARGWLTRGDLELKREDDEEAARLFRQAAVALQPIDV